VQKVPVTFDRKTRAISRASDRHLVNLDRPHFKAVDDTLKLRSGLDGQRQHTLFIANDNDFLPTVIDDSHPDGADNPNRFFVFAFTDADLPGYQPQRFESRRDVRLFGHGGRGEQCHGH